MGGATVNDDELNAKIYALEAVEFPFQVRGMEGSTKIVPYIGWGWRYVHFDAPEIWLGVYNGGEAAPFVAFMQNNKWDYPEFRVTPEQSARIREMLVAVATNPNEDTCQALFDYMQTLAPEWVKKEAQP